MAGPTIFPLTIPSLAAPHIITIRIPRVDRGPIRPASASVAPAFSDPSGPRIALDAGLPLQTPAPHVFASGNTQWTDGSLHPPASAAHSFTGAPASMTSSGLSPDVFGSRPVSAAGSAGCARADEGAAAITASVSVQVADTVVADEGLGTPQETNGAPVFPLGQGVSPTAGIAPGVLSPGNTSTTASAPTQPYNPINQDSDEEDSFWSEGSAGDISLGDLDPTQCVF